MGDDIYMNITMETANNQHNQISSEDFVAETFDSRTRPTKICHVNLQIRRLKQ